MKRLFPLLITLVLAALPVQAQTSTAEIATEIVQVGALHEATVTQSGGTRLVPLSATLTQEGTNHTATQTQTHGGLWSAGGMQATIEQVGGTGHVAVQEQGGDWLRGGLMQGDLTAYILQSGGARHRAEQYQAWDDNEAFIEQIGGAGNVAQQAQDRTFPGSLASLPRPFTLPAYSTAVAFSESRLSDLNGLDFDLGSAHRATITQTDTEGSGARQLQLGYGHDATIEQSGGAGHLALQVQIGRGHLSEIIQSGSGNEAVTMQLNGGGLPNAAHIFQAGSGNKVMITQQSY